MARDFLFGQLHPDVACAIALGLVDDPRVSVTVEAISLADAKNRTCHTHKGWLGDDPLDVLTREYMTARREAMQQVTRPGQSAWVVAAARKVKETATAKAIEARTKAFQLIQERGVLSYASRAGLKLLQLT
jgi:hypothetical protein